MTARTRSKRTTGDPQSEQAAFTPGPWVVAPCMTGGIAVFAGAHANRILATARDPYGDDDAVKEANTHLIAAAPELYEALKEMLDAYCGLGSSALAKKTAAALAKAEGRA